MGLFVFGVVAQNVYAADEVVHDHHAHRHHPVVAHVLGFGANLHILAPVFDAVPVPGKVVRVDVLVDVDLSLVRVVGKQPQRFLIHPGVVSASLVAAAVVFADVAEIALRVVSRLDVGIL